MKKLLFTLVNALLAIYVPWWIYVVILLTFLAWLCVLLSAGLGRFIEVMCSLTDKSYEILSAASITIPTYVYLANTAIGLTCGIDTATIWSIATASTTLFTLILMYFHNKK